MVDPHMAQQVYEDADATSASAGADGDEKAAAYDDAALARWKRVDGRGAHFWSALELLQLRRPWFAIFPTSKTLILLDGAVATTLRLYLNIGQGEPRCINPALTRTAPNVRSLDHSVACNRCGGPWWKIRHNEGLAAFFATAQQFNVAMQADVGSLLGAAFEDAASEEEGSGTDAEGNEPTLTKKRPDGYVVLPDRGNAAGGATLVMFDFTCAHVSALPKYSGTNPIVRARYLKVQKYRRILRHVIMTHDDDADSGATHDPVPGQDLSTRLGPEVTPIVMSTYGFLEKHSAAFMDRVAGVASRPGFAAAATSAIQVRTLNAQASGVATTQWRLRAREAQGASTRIREAREEQAQAAAAPQTGHMQASGRVGSQGVSGRYVGVQNGVAGL
jgi:hypothetical protein